MNTISERPTLETSRLILRPFSMSDAEEVRRLGGDIRVAEQLSLMPHPYPEGRAEEWISTHEEQFESGEDLIFAICEKRSGELMGSMGLHPKPDQLRSEVGYWLGVPFWGKGYATEALQEVIRFGFEERGFQRIFASHFATNPASGRVMEKAGMKLEGVSRWGCSRFGEMKDAVLRAIVKPDWELINER
ncbi:MAG: GNAT family N-acetyltransferase [Verrucomicrobiota bacterium]